MLYFPVWVLKKMVVHFGMKDFIGRTLVKWWAASEKFVKDRQDALLPGPIKGLAQFLLRVDTKVISYIDTHTHTHTHTHTQKHSPVCWPAVLHNTCLLVVVITCTHLFLEVRQICDYKEELNVVVACKFSFFQLRQEVFITDRIKAMKVRCGCFGLYHYL